MEFDIAIAFVIIVILAYLVYPKYIEYRYSEYIVSNVDGKKYLVRNTENKQEVADTLGEICLRIEKLLNYLKENGDPEYQSSIKLLEERYRKGIVYENIYMDATSYTIDKQETLMCITARDSTEKIYDINTLMFVILHELAHMANESYGHGMDFVQIFVYLLNNAIKIGIYKYVDYKKHPQEYCGDTINSTPI